MSEPQKHQFMFIPDDFQEVSHNHEDLIVDIVDKLNSLVSPSFADLCVGEIQELMKRDFEDITEQEKILSIMIEQGLKKLESFRESIGDTQINGNKRKLMILAVQYNVLVDVYNRNQEVSSFKKEKSRYELDLES